MPSSITWNKENLLANLQIVDYFVVGESPMMSARRTSWYWSNLRSRFWSLIIAFALSPALLCVTLLNLNRSFKSAQRSALLLRRYFFKEICLPSQNAPRTPFMPPNPHSHFSGMTSPEIQICFKILIYCCRRKLNEYQHVVLPACLDSFFVNIPWFRLDTDAWISKQNRFFEGSVVGETLLSLYSLVASTFTGNKAMDDEDGGEVPEAAAEHYKCYSHADQVWRFPPSTNRSVYVQSAKEKISNTAFNKEKCLKIS